jgi:hypothetical protein
MNRKRRIFIAICISLFIHGILLLVFSPTSIEWLPPQNRSLSVFSDIQEKEASSLLAMKDPSSPPTLFYPIVHHDVPKKELLKVYPSRAQLYIDGLSPVDLPLPEGIKTKNPGRISLEVKWEKDAPSPFFCIIRTNALVEDKKIVHSWVKKISCPKIPSYRPIIEGIIELEYSIEKKS